MDAERLGFADESFDFVLCGHAIFYFPQAAHEFHRILKLGGQVGMTIVAQGCLDWVFEILDPHTPGEETREDVGSRAITTADGLRNVLCDAGFENIRVVEEETDFVYVDEEEWWSALRTWGVRGSLEQMEAQVVESLKAEIFDYVQAFKRPDGVHVLIRVLYALSSKSKDCY
jgi:SAM-dependent methyltransferase